MPENAAKPRPEPLPGNPDAASAEEQLTAKAPPSSGDVLSGYAVLLAWVLSIVVHIALFGGMFMLPWLTGLADAPTDLPVARTELLSPIHPRTRVEMPRPKVTEVREVRDELQSIRPKQFQMMSEVPGVQRPELSVIGIGAGGGDASKYGLNVGMGQAGPSFFGIGQRAKGARRIVYVVDRSGSMIDTIFAVKKELKRSIRGLRRSQRFHIIFYNAGEPLENPPRKLVRAAPVLKEEAYEFIDSVTAVGSTNPLSAIRRAFAVKPDLIYFLSDGEIPVANELLLLLDTLNSEPRKTRIYTIAYVDPHGAELLEKIARTHKGEFRYVREDELFD